MKSILFISPTGTFDNGAEIALFHLMKELVRDGYQVINAYPKSYSKKQKKYVELFEDAGIKLEKMVALKWWWESAPGKMAGSSKSRNRSYDQNIFNLRKIIREDRVELVVTNTVNIFTGALAAAKEKIPHYWFIHEFPSEEFSYYLEKISFINKYSTEIFAVTGALTKELSVLFPTKKIHSFFPYTNVQLDTLRNGNDVRIINVGRISERKNQLELLKAFNQLTSPRPELIFIGPWDVAYKKKCDNFIKANQLQKVKFLGSVENPWSRLTNHDFCVFPSKMETFGLVYVESVLRGIPTIFANNPGHLSAFGIFKKGEVYPLGNTQVLLDKLHFTLDNFDNQKRNAKKNLNTIRAKNNVWIAYKSFMQLLPIQTAEWSVDTDESWFSGKQQGFITRKLIEVKYLVQKLM